MASTPHRFDTSAASPLAGLPDSIRERVWMRGSTRRLCAGEVVHVQGATGSDVFFVEPIQVLAFAVIISAVLKLSELETVDLVVAADHEEKVNKDRTKVVRRIRTHPGYRPPSKVRL